eukprot:TRINITY_DN3578_c0_g1_i1.p1 TRINITY_DN3578_c0_g1~~TRINITY_DN3578_c0_g1_i1.p1  ORF type:complete len:2700 (+),score=760.97 TRINITY_DN3578_c0_g1_i1:176-8101(+)
MEILIKHLHVPGSLALAPILDLIAVLAQDLRSEYYEFFPMVIANVPELLDPREKETMQAATQCLNYLFKFLLKQIVADVDNAFSLFVPLFRHNKEYVRNFAADTFAFIVRKLHAPQLQHLMELMFAQLSKENDAMGNGVATLMFQAVKGVQNRFHSKMPRILNMLFEQLDDSTDERNVDILHEMLELMNDHCRRNTSGDVWTALHAETKRVLELWSDDPSATTSQRLQHSVGFVQHFLESRNSNRIPNLDIAWEIIKLLIAPGVLQAPSQRTETVSQIVSLFAALMCVHLKGGNGSGPSPNVQSFFSSPDNVRFVFELPPAQYLSTMHDFCRQLMKTSQFDMYLFQITKLCNETVESWPTETLLFLHEVIMQRANTRIPFGSRSNVPLMLLRTLEQRGASDYVLSDSDMPLLWLVLRCVQHIECEFARVASALTVLSSKLSAVAVAVSAEPLAGVQSELIAAQTAVLVNTDLPRLVQMYDTIVEHLVRSSQSYPALVAFRSYVTGVKRGLEADQARQQKRGSASSLSSPFTSAASVPLIAQLCGNLSSPSHQIRTVTLDILRNYEPMAMFVNEKPGAAPRELPCTLLQHCYDLEVGPNTITDFRDKTVLMKKLETMSELKQLPEVYVPLVPNMLLGVLRVKFAMLWPVALEVLKTFAQNYFEQFWSVFSPVLHATCAKSAVRNWLSKADEMDTVVEPLQHRFDEFRNPSTTATDIFTYTTLLWDVLATIPGYVANKNREFVPLLFEFIDQEFDVVVSEGNESFPLKDVDGFNVYKIVHRKLQAFMKFFASLKNAHGIFNHQRLQSLWLRLLARSDSSVQKAAFECLLPFKFDYLMPYKDALAKLLAEDTLRETLMTFALDGEAAAADSESAVLIVDPKHRYGLVPIVSRILFGRLLAHGAAARTPYARRAAVLSFLSRMTTAEQRHLIAMLTQPFHAVVPQELLAPVVTEDALSAPLLPSILASQPTEFSQIPLRKLVGFLNVLDQVVGEMTNVIIPYAPLLLHVTLSILEHTRATDVAEIHDADIDDKADEAAKDDTDSDVPVKQIRAARVLALRRFGTMLEKFCSLHSSALDLTPFVQRFFSIVKKAVPLLPERSVQHVSPLLKIFVIMSQHLVLVPFLAQPDVLPSVLRCLSPSTVSASVSMTVLGVVESLLQWRETEHSVVQPLLAPNISLLLSELEVSLSRTSTTQSAQQKFAVGRKQLDILSRVAADCTDGKLATKLMPMLLTFVKRGSTRTDSKCNILTVFRDVMPVLEQPQQHIQFIAHQFMSLTDRELRDRLCEVWAALAKRLPELQPTVDLVTHLNAFSTGRIEEYDFEARLNAFNLICEQCGSFTYAQLAPLACICVYFTADEDMSIRSNATYSLIAIVRAIAAVVSGKSAAPVSTVGSSPLLELLNSTILPAIRRGMSARVETARIEMLKVLAEVVVLFPTQFADLNILVTDDAEVNFFTNILHIQLHRRIRALHRLTERCKEGVLTSASLLNYMLPLCLHFVYDYVKEMHHNLVDAAIASIAAMGERMSWRHYFNTISRILTTIDKKPEREKALIKLIVVLCDAFHFDLSQAANKDVDESEQDAFGGVSKNMKPAVAMGVDSDEEMADVSSKAAVITKAIAARKADEEASDSSDDDLADADGDEDGTDAAAPAVVSTTLVLVAADADRVVHVIMQQMLPRLFKLVKAKRVRSALALAIVRLLMQLPRKRMEFVLPRLLIELCEQQASRDQVSRDQARETIVSITEMLGSHYFLFVIEQLRGALKRGYQIHVLGYTVHAILASVTRKWAIGALDHAVPELTSLLLEDIFGEVAQEKDVKQLAKKMKESKKIQSYDSFELLARTVTFTPHITLVVNPLQEMLAQVTTSKKQVAKLEKVLQRVAAGINANRSADKASLLLFVDSIMRGNTDLELEERVAAELKEAQAAKSSGLEKPVIVHGEHFLLEAEPTTFYRPTMGSKQLGQAASVHVAVEFAVGLLHTWVKHKKFNTDDETITAMLDPFLPRLTDCILSKHNQTAIASLKSLSHLIQMKLPSSTKCIANMVRRSFNVIGQVAVSDSDVVQACFKLLAIVIRDFKWFGFKDSQMKVLLKFIMMDMSASSKQHTTFALLKGIVGRRVLVAEVYDIMPKLGELLVRSEDTTLRQQCRRVMLDFLLHYPLADKRRSQHLDFLVKNLEYSYESGRESVLEMLNSICIRYPQDQIDERAEVFFVPLVLRLVSDDSKQCRVMTEAVLKVLLKRVSKDPLANIIGYVTSWLTHDKLALRRVSMIVIGLLVETLTDDAPKFLKQFLPAIVAALQMKGDDEVQADEVAMSGGEFSSDVKPGKTSPWMICFEALVTLEKFVRVTPACIDMTELVPVLEQCCTLLQHPHAWVRFSACRFVSMWFEQRDATTLCIRNTKRKDALLNKPGAIFAIARSLCTQMLSNALEDRSGATIVKNLLWVCSAMHHNPTLCTKGERVETADNEQAGDVDDVASNDEVLHSVKWVVVRLSYAARQDRPVQRMFIFRFFAALCGVLGADAVQPLLSAMLSPLFRVSEGENKDDAVVQLSNEAMDVIKTCVGQAVFFETYQNVRAAVGKIRFDRKRERAVLAVTDPEEHARRRMKTNLKARERRKRKVEKYQGQRESIKVKRGRVDNEDEDGSAGVADSEL